MGVTLTSYVIVYGMHVFSFMLISIYIYLYMIYVSNHLRQLTGVRILPETILTLWNFGGLRVKTKKNDIISCQCCGAQMLYSVYGL